MLLSELRKLSSARLNTMTITFYDIPSQVPGKAWSPNTFKARIALNYKGIPFTTEWVEYPDIEPLLKKIGGAPTSKKEDGRDHYTLPAIHDSETGKVVTDSLNIAVYLDEKFPEKPLLFPHGTRAAIELFLYHFETNFHRPLRNLLLPPCCNNLNPFSEEYFRRTREASFGCKMEEISPKGPKRDELWTEFQQGLARLSEWYAKNGRGKRYFLGDTFSFADAIMVGNLLWAEKATHDEYVRVASWDSGRWGELVEATRQYQGD